jgi:hypothetical protein
MFSFHRIAMQLFFCGRKTKQPFAFIFVVAAAQLHQLRKNRVAPQKELLFHAQFVSFAASIRNGCRESGGLPTG